MVLVSISSPSSEGGGQRLKNCNPIFKVFPLVLLQAKVVGEDGGLLPSLSGEVSISSPSSEGGGLKLHF